MSLVFRVLIRPFLSNELSLRQHVLVVFIQNRVELMICCLFITTRVKKNIVLDRGDLLL